MTTRAVLDTTVLVSDMKPDDVEASISVVSIAELHFGVLAASGDPDELARRSDRLARVEAMFDPLPVTTDVAREYGRLAAAVRHRGAQPRRRQLDLLIGATANVEKVPLLTANLDDFSIIRDLVDARPPESPHMPHVWSGA